MEGKIKILVVPSDFHGVGKYRSVDPHVYIQEHYADEFHIDIIPMSEFPQDNLMDFFKTYDLIHVHKQLDDQYECLQTIKFLGIPLIVDVDDTPIYTSDSMMYIMAHREKWTEKILEHLHKADYVTTTTNLFANRLKKYNKNVHVFPNAIDEQEKQFTNNKYKNGKLKFGIVCGSTHLKDIELLASISKLPQEYKDKMQISLCGFDTNGTQYITSVNGKTIEMPMPPENNVWTKYEEILTDNYKNVSPMHKSYLRQFVQQDDIFDNEFYKRYWTKDIKHYGQHYEHVDVLLAPLKECETNYCKSQLKAIEAGFTNTAIIAQEYGPYTIDLTSLVEKGGKINENGNALLVGTGKNHKDWVKYIKLLIDHPEYVDILKKNLRNTIHEKYTLEKVCKERVDFYKSIVRKS